jgi:hypothetical protein
MGSVSISLVLLLIAAYTAGACVAAVHAIRNSLRRRPPRNYPARPRFRNRQDAAVCFLAAFIVGLVWPFFFFVWTYNKIR